ncbi:hypothetical protein PILCRDRAFT_125777 [Piloderma croceum F 1598]|uniref:Uncharacterized protein n=1 Tax=Piloderma croceum (strain F 1598) TaxID=765440 RepID=A0A0C3BXP0_PILCF|nr:hypothetical protein PILCRDRAFT_125777 [Piloderma croceum F 1598]
MDNYATDLGSGYQGLQRLITSTKEINQEKYRRCNNYLRIPSYTAVALIKAKSLDRTNDHTAHNTSVTSRSRSYPSAFPNWTPVPCLHELPLPARCTNCLRYLSEECFEQ